MPSPQDTAYPCLKSNPTEKDLIRLYTPTSEELVDLINIAIEELVRQRFELPGFSTLDRAARTVRKAHLDKLYEQVSEALMPAERQHLTNLFKASDEGTPWERLKQEPGKPLLSRLKDWTERLQWLTTFSVSSTALTGIPPIKVQQFAAEAQTLDAACMKALPLAKQATLAVALLTQQYGQTLDDVTDRTYARTISSSWCS